MNIARLGQNFSLSISTLDFLLRDKTLPCHSNRNRNQPVRRKYFLAGHYFYYVHPSQRISNKREDKIFFVCFLLYDFEFSVDFSGIVFIYQNLYFLFCLIHIFIYQDSPTLHSTGMKCFRAVHWRPLTCQNLVGFMRILHSHSLHHLLSEDRWSFSRSSFGEI